MPKNKKERTKLGPFQTVFKGVIFEIQQAEATLANGAKKIFEHVVRPASVSVLAIDGEGRLLLTREYRPKYRRYAWRIPAGTVELGESPRRAAQRELQEEAGVRAKRLRLFHKTTTSQSIEWSRYTYLATNLEPAPLSGDEDEDITVVPTSIPDAYQMVLDGKITKETICYLIFKLYHHYQ